VAQYATTLDQERKQAGENLAVVNQAQQKLADAFKALAAEALKSNNQSFLDLAKATLGTFQETAKGDLEKRQQAIQELVKPVRESLDKVDTKINELEKARAGAYTGLTEQVKSLMDTQKQLQSETATIAIGIQ
jgi:DNA recombination protein RmuC